MPAIITDQFRILNAETFTQSFTGIGTTTNYYYTFLGHPNPTNVNIGDYGELTWSTAPPGPQDSFKDENSYHDSMLFLKKVTSDDVVRVIKRNNWQSGITYDMYRNDYSIDNAASQTSAKSLYSAKYIVVNSEYKVYACLNNGSNPAFPKGQKSLAEPNFVNAIPQVAGTGSDGYLWKYLFTISPADVVKFSTDAYIPLPKKWGDANTSIVKNAAVDGAIQTIVIKARGSGYKLTAGNATTGTVTNVPIFGDGSGGFASVTINSGEVDTIQVTSNGTNYTKAFIKFDPAFISDLGTGTGSGAEFEVIIPPQGGHGDDIYRELGGYRVMVYSKYDVDSDYVTGNTFARVGIVKNPTIYSSETEPFKEQTATALGALKLKPDPGSGVSTTTDTVYPINAQITQKVGIASTAIGYVASWNKDTGILRYYQPVGLTTLTAAGNKLLNFAGIQTSIICTDAAFVGSQLVVDTDFDNANTITVGTKIHELGQTFNDGIANPDVRRHSGEIIYVDNRAPITRSTSQKEEVKIVVEF